MRYRPIVMSGPKSLRCFLRTNLFSVAEAEPTRASYARTLLEIGERNPMVVVLDADVSKSIGTNKFAEKFPERSFNFGIAEQNMFAAAAGMATTGLIPFATTYAVFASLRALDMVRNSIHYPRLNVKIAASHSGITPGPDGVTHQGQEDLSIMRSIANSTVIAPADADTTALAVEAAIAYDGPVYLSFTRDPVPKIFTPDYPFEIGKAVTVRDGSDATIFAIRDLTAHALVAAEQIGRPRGRRTGDRLPHPQTTGCQVGAAGGRRNRRDRDRREQHFFRRAGQRRGRSAGGESSRADEADRREGYLCRIGSVSGSARQIRPVGPAYRDGRGRGFGT